MKKLSIVIAALIIVVVAGLLLRPVIWPSSKPVADAAPTAPALAPANTEARGVQYFTAHIDEARRIAAGCQDGSVRGDECANAQQAVEAVDGKARLNKFLGN
jgi:hypothetical protein